MGLKKKTLGVICIKLNLIIKYELRKWGYVFPIYRYPLKSYFIFYINFGILLSSNQSFCFFWRDYIYLNINMIVKE